MWNELIPLICCVFLLRGTLSIAADLTTYETPYYTIYTDLPQTDVREAAMRMTRMAEEYANRTRDFAGAIDKRMPVYLYSNPDDFYATGAPKTAAGYYNGRELVVLAKNADARTWHTVQHEGFHQFADQVIRGDLPMWINEGLAEYFGEALFTGDGFVSGVIPQWRLQRIRETLTADQFKPASQLMSLTRDQWNSELAIINYDQGWSMVQFLAHGEQGKYQKALGSFIGALGQGTGWQQAWNDAFGSTEGFEQDWKQYWTKLPDNPTIDLYTQANVSTLTSFLGRAHLQKQTFADFATFAQSARDEQLKIATTDWLPPGLLKTAMEQTDVLTRAGYVYSIETPRGENLPQIKCVMKQGQTFVGRFVTRGGKIESVNVQSFKR